MSAKDDAQLAVFTEVKAIIEASKDTLPAHRAEILRKAALAYRLAAGGTQPGGSVVEKG
ncbi:hypothetical protein [Blastococcus sp. TBT05-19]|uniref:hypothetical protein n=1 Tax=Blastococcus sp. TBT05-19 TaxID=2250581 RepID=UPI001314F1BC|nr:hypothetical protein [Blastococcus sp. TBT05-19]